MKQCAGGAKIVKSDIVAKNGVIQAIDKLVVATAPPPRPGAPGAK